MSAHKTLSPVLNRTAAPVQTQGVPPAPGHSMEIYISQVLRIGVFTSALIILVGLVLYVSHGAASSSGHQSVNQVIDSSRSLSVSPGSIWHGILTGDAVAIIQLGVLALILTPMTRVAMTAVLFLKERDQIFVTITTIVFLVLIFGLIGIGS